MNNINKRKEGIGIEIFDIFSQKFACICVEGKTPSVFSSNFLASDVEIFLALL